MGMSFYYEKKKNQKTKQKHHPKSKTKRKHNQNLFCLRKPCLHAKDYHYVH